MRIVLASVAGLFLASSVSAATLSTGFAGGNRGSGNMFNIEIGAAPINLTDIEVHIGASVTTTVSFWYRTGSYVGFETTPTGWTLLDQALLNGQGAGNPTPWDLTDQMFEANTLYGLFIHDNSSDTGYTNVAGAPTAVLASNTDLSIFVGVGLGANFPTSLPPTGGEEFFLGAEDPFSYTVYQDRAWNGTLNYQITPAAVPLPAGGGMALAGLAGLAGLALRSRRKRKTA